MDKKKNGDLKFGRICIHCKNYPLDCKGTIIPEKCASFKERNDGNTQSICDSSQVTFKIK